MRLQVLPPAERDDPEGVVVRGCTENRHSEFGAIKKVTPVISLRED
jgi:hypothetical protein